MRKLTISISDVAYETLERKAKEMGMSKSRLIELILAKEL
ncbi:MAG: ribbon-helix-helix protein, CopG family [Candidatus Methanomethylicaceae archaeon]